MNQRAGAEAANPAPDIRVVGIAGGGQLAQMMLPAARALGLEVVVLDPDPACSAAAGARDIVVGEFQSAAALRELSRRCDVITFEIERINAAALAELEGEGVVVRPRASILAVIQDKLAQKRFLAEHDIPTSAFAPWTVPSPLPRPLPCVWKARRDGYDGRGVSMLREDADVGRLPAGEALVEALVDIDYELATLVARGADGGIVHYPVVDILMDPQAHVMDSVIAPSRAPQPVLEQARALATRVADALDYVGVLALEFFVDRDGRVLVNELSPRPHNSGHYTIEACATSQFEQHLRAVAALPLGSAALHHAAVTFNVLGAAGARGRPRNVGFEHAGGDVFVHDYAKPEVRPGRKMAHVTVIAEDRDSALARAAAIKGEIRVEGADE